MKIDKFDRVNNEMVEKSENTEESEPMVYLNLDSIKNREDEDISLSSTLQLSLKLGCISFGGPAAHIGYFKKYFIDEKKYISEDDFLQLFSICSILPGPTSSQLFTAICTIKTRSVIGGIVSFLGFNMPALLIILGITILINFFQEKMNNTGVTLLVSFLLCFSSGITQAAISLVIQAAFTLSVKSRASVFHSVLLGVSAITYFIFMNYYSMIGLMLIGGIASFFRAEEEFLIKSKSTNKFIDNSFCLGWSSLAIFFVYYGVVLGLNFYIGFSNLDLMLMESFFRIGAIIFGGGHVVIPLILTEFASLKLISETDVLNGFSIVSFLPGPMFNLAGYVGYKINGILAGFLSAFSIFLPGILLILASIPFIKHLNKNEGLQHFFAGLATVSVGFIFSSALRLFIDAVFINQQIYFLFGIFNIALCVTFLIYFKLSAPVVILTGGVYGLIYQSILTAI